MSNTFIVLAFLNMVALPIYIGRCIWLKRKLNRQIHITEMVENKFERWQQGNIPVPEPVPVAVSDIDFSKIDRLTIHAGRYLVFSSSKNITFRATVTHCPEESREISQDIVSNTFAELLQSIKNYVDSLPAKVVVSPQ